jgi:hypothetical protein
MPDAQPACDGLSVALRGRHSGPITPPNAPGESTMHYWITIIDVVGELVALAAAVVTLIAARRDRNGK